jgi:hypothetical protein
MTDRTETPARGTTGFLLSSPDGKWWFRVYEPDPTRYTDYQLAAEAIKITIEDTSVSLQGDKLGWRSDLTRSHTEHRGESTVLHINGAMGVYLKDGTAVWFPPAYMAAREGRPYEVSPATITRPYWTRGPECKNGVGPDLTDEEIESVWPK